MDKDNLKTNVKYHSELPVDIIIPFHGQYHHLSECLRSVITITKAQLFTITVIDDASPNEDFLIKLQKDKLPNIPIQYLRNKTQMGFGASLARGFGATQNAWILFMHSDCKAVHTDWLMNMVLIMKEMRDNGVKLISAKVDHGGTGGFDPAIIGTIDRTPNVIVEQPLPLICSLVHRALFDHIDGFIKPYPYGWYEDEELFWRMKLCGYKQAVCGKAFVKHAGGVAVRELTKNPIIRSQMETNRDTYINDIREFAKQRKSV